MRGDKPFLSHVQDIAIYFPLEDRYESSAVCLKYRCHTHVFCGGNVSFILVLRMGGEAPHLGMALTEGSLSAYSIERDKARGSNDRGCFLLHPSPMESGPGEQKRICWTIFPHAGKADFVRCVEKLTRFIKVEAEHYVLFRGEKCRVRILPPLRPGVARRCRFIAEKQQYRGKLRQLEGAYLAYDNEENTPVYTPRNDWNGGRERVAMGLLIARYLQGPDPKNRELLEASLQDFLDYVARELVNVDTGCVYNDISEGMTASSGGAALGRVLVWEKPDVGRYLPPPLERHYRKRV